MATNDVYLRPDAGDGVNGVRLRPDAPDAGGVSLTPDVGLVTLTGYAPTVERGVDKAYIAVGSAGGIYVCETGTRSEILTGLYLSETAVSTSVSNTAAPDVGLITLTGYAPVVSYPTNAAPAVGVVTLTGYAPEVSQSVPKSYIAVGSAGGIYVVETGIRDEILTGLYLSETTVPVAVSNSASPDVGLITLTGYAPTVASPLAVAPAVGLVTLTGYAPTIAQPLAVAPAVGLVTLTGYAPTIAQQLAVAPAVGLVTLTGYAPTIAQPLAVAPAVGLVTLTGYAPTVGQAHIASPAVGLVVITGYAPSVVSGGRLKYWNGSAWVLKTLKYWDGSAWQTKTLKYWNGAAWV